MLKWFCAPLYVSGNVYARRAAKGSLLGLVLPIGAALVPGVDVSLALKCFSGILLLLAVVMGVRSAYAHDNRTLTVASFGFTGAGTLIGFWSGQLFSSGAVPSELADFANGLMLLFAALVYLVTLLDIFCADLDAKAARYREQVR